MTNEQKLEILKAQNYGSFELRIEEHEGTIYVNCWYTDEMYPLDEIVLIDYMGNENLPINQDTLESNFVKCANCGAWIDFTSDDYVHTSDTDEDYCDDCYDDCTFYCEYHDEREAYPEDSHWVMCNSYEQLWCQRAVECGAFWSDYSERYYSDYYHDSVDVYDEYGDRETYTANEACEYAYWCDHCENYFTSNAFNFDHDVCNDCYENGDYSEDDDDEYDNALDLLNSYHYSKNHGTLHFFGESKYVNPVGIGFELEIDTSYENAMKNQGKLLRAIHGRFGDRLTFETDGSLANGFEIISAPHTKSEMYLVDWTELLTLCKEHGYESHDMNTCGLHFHVSGYMFGATKEKQHDTIAKVIAFYEYYYNEFVKISRRDMAHARRWADNYGLTYNGNMATYKDKCRNIVEQYAEFCNNDRYNAINLTNRANGGLFKTVEFRINRGTLNENTFYASFDMILQLVKNAKKIDWNDSDFFNPRKWFSGCKANTYAYIMKRGAFEGTFYLPQANNDTEYTQENA